MSKEKRRVPKLRFPGFTEDWEQRKLNDLVTIRRGLTYKPSDIAENGIRVLRSSNIDEDQFITSNDDVFVNIEAVNIPFAKNGDILITSANGSNRLVGKHTIISDIADNSAVHGGFMLLAESNNPLFTDALLSSNWYKRFINTYVAGGNGAIGNLSKSDLESQTVMIPSEHEQAKIGQWYDNINQLITLHQRKLEHLNLKKKALLQKLFPKNGERYPELRFPGFTDAWEQCKLGDIVDFLDGQRKPLKESERIKGKYPYYGASGIIDYINDYLFDENLVLLSEDGANIIDRNYPVCFIATGKYWVNNHAHVLKVKTGVIDKFICESLERLDYTKFNTGTAQPKLNQDICQKIIITIPNESEQKCISEFLVRINNIITLHQRKLEHLQLQKKALLQQMFV